MDVYFFVNKKGDQLINAEKTFLHLLTLIFLSQT